MASCLLGPVGADIVYAALCPHQPPVPYQFSPGRVDSPPPAKEPADAEAEPQSADEIALERRAHELEKQAKKLKEEVARSGLGADMQPVPEPTVRDLSVPQAKPTTSPRIRKTTLPGPAKEPEAAVRQTGGTAVTARSSCRRHDRRSAGEKGRSR